ncbi:unnamed protein product [Closterium sp. NIES-54]
MAFYADRSNQCSCCIPSPCLFLRPAPLFPSSPLSPLATVDVERTDRHMAFYADRSNLAAMSERTPSVDVERTDRHMAFYADRSNLAAMSDILAVHAWIDPATGFCQGMCDLLSPFIILFPHPADAFWCFESLFSRIRHNFLTEGPVGILRQLAVLRDVVALVDPELASHLEELGADNFMFAFRMLLVLFRRELPLLDVIVMWEELGADNFMFAFRMLLVLFRRELPLLDVIVMWEVRSLDTSLVGGGLDGMLQARWVMTSLTAPGGAELDSDKFLLSFRLLLVLFGC